MTVIDPIAGSPREYIMTAILALYLNYLSLYYGSYMYIGLGCPSESIIMEAYM